MPPSDAKVSSCTHLSQIQTSTVTSIVVIAIHMENLLALNRQQTRENTLRQTSTEDDDLCICR